MIRSIFIPTPQVEQFSNYYLVQLLAKERINCLMTGEKFEDKSLELVQKYLTIPSGITTAKQEEDFFKATAKEVMASFKVLEKFPMYEDAMKQLKVYENHKHEVTSVTTSGLMVLIEVPEAGAA